MCETYPCPKSAKFKDEEYETVPQAAIVASKWLTDVWKQLGKPETPFTQSGQKMMKVIISVWEDLFPLQMKMWYADRAEHLKNELSVNEQVHQHTGRSLASYPYPIFQMMKTIFKNFHPAERSNCMKMVKIWPMFRMVNKI